jgi:hypothetical protein
MFRWCVDTDAMAASGTAVQGGDEEPIAWSVAGRPNRTRLPNTLISNVLFCGNF